MSHNSYTLVGNNNRKKSENHEEAILFMSV